MRQLGPTDLKRLHREWNRRPRSRVALLLDGVASPYNVGSIVRTAAAFKIDHVYLAGGALSPAHGKTGRTSMGTERYLTWTTFERGPDAAAAARQDGYLVIGIELAEGAAPLHEAVVGEATCLALGHEDHGLTPATLAACDAVAFVPQLGKVGSLNVATAAAIAMYELRRRDWTNPNLTASGGLSADDTEAEVVDDEDGAE
jgi:tRNA (guanosine-2'-O-)-methyltransferase